MKAAARTGADRVTAMPVHFFDTVPIPILYVGLLVLFAVAVEIGYLLGDRRQRNTDYIDEGRTAQSGVVLGAMLTLSGFLIGFTFSMAGGQFDNRREIVIDDANAIGTAFLRTAQLPEPYRSNSQCLFGEYVDRRATLFDDAPEEQLARSERIQEYLWADATEIARSSPSPIISIYVQSLNEMIDIHGKRAYVELFMRIPDAVIATISVLSLLTMGLTGYLLGLRGKRWGLPTALMIVTYATVFVIVVDLDRPVRGLFFGGQHADRRTQGKDLEKLVARFGGRTLARL